MEGLALPNMKGSVGKILMFVENSFPQDPRVGNEADALNAAGYQLTVVGLRQPGQPWTEIIDGVRVYRIPRLELFEKTFAGSGGLRKLRRRLTAGVGYMGEYVYFSAACFLMSILVALRHGFDVIHAHNPPDTLFAVALPYKLLGKKFVFDHHDLCPELYSSRMGNPNKAIYRSLMFVERCSLKLADIVIATNESYKRIAMQRGGRRAESIFVVRNGPNARKMTIAPPSTRLRAMGKVVLCYIGCLNPQDGVDYLLRALHHLLVELRRTDFYCVVMGSGDSLEELRALRVSLGLEDYLELPGFVSEEELVANLSAADICVDPDPSSPLNDQSTWIKIMEYMAYGKPIVSFDLKETRVSAQDAAVYVPPNDTAAFARAIVQLMDDPARRQRMGQFGRHRVEKELQWSVVRQNLIAAYRTFQ